MLNGVWCNGRVCTAVGGYYYGTAAEYTLVEDWTGSAWQVEPSPDTVRYSSLEAVSCASAVGCVAVGVSGNALSYAELYQAGRWRLTNTQNPV